MELTMRLLVGPVILIITTLLLTLPLPTQAVEENIPTWLMRNSYNGGGMTQSLSRQQELSKALQFLEEYERNLAGDAGDEEESDYASAWQSDGDLLPLLRGGSEEDEDEDIVPEEFLEMEPEEDTQGEFMNVLQNVISAYRNRNDAPAVSSPQRGYPLKPQRSAFNTPYELFSPVDAELEDELALEDAIVRLEFKAKKQRLWEGILKDMLAEEMVEKDAEERFEELVDLEETEEMVEDEIAGQDTIFEEEDPWEALEDLSSSSFEEADDEESSVVDTGSWTWPGDEESSVFDDDNEEIIFPDDDEDDDYDDPDTISPEVAEEIEREAAEIIYEELLAEEEMEKREQRAEDEEEEEEEAAEELLAMIAGAESDDEEEDDYTDLDNNSFDQDTEDAIVNYFKRMMLQNDNNDEDDAEEEAEEEAILEAISNELGAGDDDEEEEESSEVEAIWEDSSSADLIDMEELEEAIQDYDAANNDDDEEEEEEEEEEEDYNALLQEITNEIEAAAKEVEDEVVAAFRQQLLEEEENDLENNLDNYLNEEDLEDEYEDEDEDEYLAVDKKDYDDDSTDILDELDAEQILRLVNTLGINKQQQPQQQPAVEEFTNTESDTCPIYRWLVDDCAFIVKFPGVDDDGLYRNLFQRACNRHQLCYTCGAAYEIEGTLCNEVFEAEMIAECGDNDECVNAADQFSFAATNTYQRASESPPFCQARCLMQNLVMDVEY